MIVSMEWFVSLIYMVNPASLYEDSIFFKALTKAPVLYDAFNWWDVLHFGGALDHRKTSLTNRSSE